MKIGIVGDTNNLSLEINKKTIDKLTNLQYNNISKYCKNIYST